MTDDGDLIEPIRAASRHLVRELGFLGGAFAGTALSPSAVHALIEIDCRPGLTARHLAEALRLEKSSVSRLLDKLVRAGDLREEVDATDSRAKKLFLSKSGQARTAAIHAHARRQVAGALTNLAPGQDRTVMEGLRLYAGALAGRRDGRDAAKAIRIARGYRSGLIGRVTEMHARYYARTADFGQAFESVVAGGLAAFCDRLAHPRNAVWAALDGRDIVGSVAIDGEDLGEGIAHLRWFIVDDGARGTGIGRELLGTALSFADAQDFAETQLWTFSGLAAARHLYEAHGFRCVEERVGRQWGREVLEQRFARPRGGRA
ncbi:MarR family transcriptional regulator [Aureimonas endophytica]|uniref:MarR family transcriptional regulator n=1 Tax=Aureimonas endophytica TaxID=2027858 RepID=A0A917E3L4_9HYPH|nr:helix-turn-helix domain-containing GNAT family N-acetyltransferase [Aureimonas endophytica]GGD99801.1 MarR family transcriptional regulator [Aureimonas endophytica]